MVERSLGTLQALIELKRRAVAAAQQRLADDAAAVARLAECLDAVERGHDLAAATLAARATLVGRAPLVAAALVEERRYRSRLERELRAWAARVGAARRELEAARWGEEQAQRALVGAQAQLRAFERHLERQEHAMRRRLELLEEQRLDDLRSGSRDAAVQGALARSTR